MNARNTTRARRSARALEAARRALALCAGASLGAAAALALVALATSAPDGVEWLVPRLCDGISRIARG